MSSFINELKALTKKAKEEKAAGLDAETQAKEAKRLAIEKANRIKADKIILGIEAKARKRASEGNSDASVMQVSSKEYNSHYGCSSGLCLLGVADMVFKFCEEKGMSPKVVIYPSMVECMDDQIHILICW